MNACYHEHYEPVTLITGEQVNTLCTDCLAELPPNWGCTECDWVEISTLGDWVPRYLPGAPCRQHLSMMGFT